MISSAVLVYGLSRPVKDTHTQEMIIPFLFDTTLRRAQSPTAANTLTVVFDAVCVDESDI